MKLLVALLFLTFSAVFAQNGPQERFFTQPLNHHVNMNHKWEQRYFVNKDHFLIGGPIFIYVGKGFEYFETMYRGEVFDFSKSLNGIMFALEHRFYGASRPSTDVSHTSLEHLTVEQALADIAEFIQYIKDFYPGTEDSKVILYGEEYGAALAVWARQKYPHLVTGVWASSAYISPKINHQQMAVRLGEAFKRIGGQECYDVLENAFRTIEILVWLNDTQTIKESLKQCKDLDTEDPTEVSWLFLNLVQVIQDFVKYASYGQLEESCEKLVANASNDKYFESFSSWLRFEVQPNVFCQNFNYKDMVHSYSQWQWETVGTAGGARQTMWLHCNQLGQFATSDANGQHPFGHKFDLSVFQKFCNELFPNHRLVEENKKLNTTYGDLNPAVTNVFFTNGEFDPKLELGLTKKDMNAEVVVIPLHTAGKDLKASTPSDNPALKRVKTQAKSNMLKWILNLATETEAMEILLSKH